MAGEFRQKPPISLLNKNQTVLLTIRELLTTSRNENKMKERDKKMEDLDDFYARADRIVNLTPRTITVLVQGRTINIPPSGRLAKVFIKRDEDAVVGYLQGEIPIFEPAAMEISGIPEPQPGVVYITSTLIAQVIKRKDVLSPDTLPGGMIKDPITGRPRGVSALQYWGDKEED